MKPETYTQRRRKDFWRGMRIVAAVFFGIPLVAVIIWIILELGGKP